MDHKDPDVSLMIRASQGDDRAFAILFTKHKQSAVNFARRYFSDAQRAEDAAQETFIKLYRARASYQPTSHFRAYLFRICANTCINMLRRHDVAKPAHDDEQLHAVADARISTPEDRLAGEELKRALEAALSKLPPAQREAFILLRFENMSYEQISQATGATVSAVRALLNRARRELTVALGGYLAHFDMPYAVAA